MDRYACSALEKKENRKILKEKLENSFQGVVIRKEFVYYEIGYRRFVCNLI
jgi:hypothetical protein